MIPDVKVEAYLRENLPAMNWQNEQAVNALYFDLLMKENHPFDLLDFGKD